MVSISSKHNVAKIRRYHYCLASSDFWFLIQRRQDWFSKMLKRSNVWKKIARLCRSGEWYTPYSIKLLFLKVDHKYLTKSLLSQKRIFDILWLFPLPSTPTLWLQVLWSSLAADSKLSILAVINSFQVSRFGTSL